MQNTGNRLRLIRSAILLVSISLLGQCIECRSSYGQQQVNRSGEGIVATYPVFVFGKELFGIHSSKADGEKTAHDTSRKIEELVYDQNFKAGQLIVKDTDGHSAIAYGANTLLSVSDEDARAEAMSPASLARQRLDRIISTIEAERARRNFHDAIDQVNVSTLKSNLIYVLGNPLILRGIIGLIGLLLIVVIGYTLKRSVPKYFHESYKRYIVSKVTEFSTYFLALVFLCVVFSDTLGSLAVILGAATAGVAFALKELIASIAGWIGITFGDSYRVGDRIQLGGVRGDVIDIGLVRTTLMETGEWVQGDLYTGRIVRVANGTIFAGPLFNYSRDLPFLWDELVINVKYGSDLERSRGLIQGVVDKVVGEYGLAAKQDWQRLKEKYVVEDERIDPTVTLALNKDNVEFTVRYPVDYRRRRETKDAIFSGIAAASEKSGDKFKIY